MQNNLSYFETRIIVSLVYLGGDPRKYSREVEEVRTGSKGHMMVATMGNWNPVLLGKTLAGSGVCTCQTYPLKGWGGQDLGISLQLSAKGCSQVLLTPWCATLGQAWIKWGLAARESPQAGDGQAARIWGHVHGNCRCCGDMGEAPRASAIQTLTYFILQKPCEVGTITFPLFPRRTQPRRVRSGICCFYPVTISSLFQ